MLKEWEFSEMGKVILSMGAVPRKSILGAAPSPRARRDKKVLGNREGGGPARSETQQGHLG